MLQTLPHSQTKTGPPEDQDTSLHRPMAQHRQAMSPGQDSTLRRHGKEDGHSFEDGRVREPAREDRCFDKGRHPSQVGKAISRTQPSPAAARDQTLAN